MRYNSVASSFGKSNSLLYEAIPEAHAVQFAHGNFTIMEGDEEAAMSKPSTPHTARVAAAAVAAPPRSSTP